MNGQSPSEVISLTPLPPVTKNRKMHRNNDQMDSGSREKHVASFGVSCLRLGAVNQ